MCVHVSLMLDDAVTADRRELWSVW